jgi:hypothetical protein
MLMPAWLAGCEREVFEHGAAAQAQQADGGPFARNDGGRPPADQCAGAKDGTRCDDWDPCTPSSSCRGGQCAPGVAFDDCTIADSAAEFGETQGEQGWFYGYYAQTADADGSYDPTRDFVAMEYCGEGAWRPDEVCGLTREQPGFRWTENLNWGLQHPETEPELELPVRRWVSDVSGPATLSIAHEVGGEYSDGTRALLLFDGEPVWRHDAQGGGRDAVMNDTMPIELHLGMVIDQLVHPIETSADDTTYFTIRIEGR